MKRRRLVFMLWYIRALGRDRRGEIIIPLGQVSLWLGDDEFIKKKCEQTNFLI